MLVVWGEKDRMVFSKGADRVLAEVEGSAIVFIEDCGHYPQVERPDGMAELLVDFPAALAEPPRAARP